MLANRAQFTAHNYVYQVSMQKAIWYLHIRPSLCGAMATNDKRIWRSGDGASW